MTIAGPTKQECERALFHISQAIAVIKVVRYVMESDDLLADTLRANECPDALAGAQNLLDEAFGPLSTAIAGVSD